MATTSSSGAAAAAAAALACFCCLAVLCCAPAALAAPAASKALSAATAEAPAPPSQAAASGRAATAKSAFAPQPWPSFEATSAEDRGGDGGSDDAPNEAGRPADEADAEDQVYRAIETLINRIMSDSAGAVTAAEDEYNGDGVPSDVRAIEDNSEAENTEEDDDDDDDATSLRGDYGDDDDEGETTLDGDDADDDDERPAEASDRRSSAWYGLPESKASGRQRPQSAAEDDDDDDDEYNGVIDGKEDVSSIAEESDEDAITSAEEEDGLEEFREYLEYRKMMKDLEAKVRNRIELENEGQSMNDDDSDRDDDYGDLRRRKRAVGESQESVGSRRKRSAEDASGGVFLSSDEAAYLQQLIARLTDENENAGRLFNILRDGEEDSDNDDDESDSDDSASYLDDEEDIDDDSSEYEVADGRLYDLLSGRRRMAASGGMGAAAYYGRRPPVVSVPAAVYRRLRRAA